MKTIIVGGVAGGMSAATRLRRLDENREIIVLEKSEYVSFANCGLPYYVGQEIVERSELIVQSPEQLKARFQLDVRVRNEVIAINTDKKEVMVLHDGKTYVEAYDELILSPGAKPIVPRISGVDENTKLYTVRNIPDIDKIMQRLDDSIRSVVVLGAGFIGLEMAENLHKRGLDVTIVDRLPHVLSSVDIEMATFLHKEIERNGIHLLLEKQVNEIHKDGKQLVLSDGGVIDTDMIVFSIGVQADTGFASAAGIATTDRGNIIIDENYETNIKDIYAVGDATVSKHWITKQPVMIALASPANRQGRQVADVIVNHKRNVNKGNLGTAIVRICDQVLAFTGLNERQLKEVGYNYAVLHTQSKDHAGYYPGSTNMDLKLLFHKETGQIYGAQAVGAKGIDKRIDVLATAIKGNLTIFDLPELELSYAPPFGSAKDAVNMLGYAAMNIVEGFSQNIQWYEVQEACARGAVLLDVREPGEQDRGIIKGAIKIPLHTLRNHLNELDTNKEMIVYCHSGLRSYLAERILKQHGFDKVKNLDGAYHLYAMMYPDTIVR